MPKRSGSKSSTSSSTSAAKHEHTTHGEAVLHPHGDGTAHEVPNVNSNGEYPPRKSDK